MEKIIFQAKTRYAKEMVKRGVYGMALLPPYRSIFRLFRTLLVMLAVFVLIAGAGYLIQDQAQLGVLGLVQAVLYTALGVGFTKVLAWAIWVCIPKARLVNRYDFTEKGFTIDDGKKARSYPYGKIKGLLESGACFYLVTSPGGLCPVEKNGFTQGEGGEFKAFLERKCPGLACHTI